MFQSIFTALKPSETQTYVVDYSAALAQRLNAQLNACVVFDVDQIAPREALPPGAGALKKSRDEELTAAARVAAEDAVRQTLAAGVTAAIRCEAEIRRRSHNATLARARLASRRSSPRRSRRSCVATSHPQEHVAPRHRIPQTHPERQFRGRRLRRKSPSRTCPVVARRLGPRHLSHDSCCYLPCRPRRGDVDLRRGLSIPGTARPRRRGSSRRFESAAGYDALRIDRSLQCGPAGARSVRPFVDKRVSLRIDHAHAAP